MASKRGKEQAGKGQRNQHTRRRGWLIAAALIAVLVVATVVLRPRSKAVTVSPERLADDPSLGPANAPVTIIEYGDFGCPTCRAWHNAGVLKQIRAQYGDQVRFVWRDFPIITAQSPKAAEAAQCAYDQGKFWEYHDLLFARAPALSVKDLKAYAAQLELDTAQFNRCLDSGEHEPTVQRDWQDARSRGFPGTPSFLINGQPLIGPPSAALLKQKIDAILSSGG